MSTTVIKSTSDFAAPQESEPGQDADEKNELENELVELARAKERIAKRETEIHARLAQLEYERRIREEAEKRAREEAERRAREEAEKRAREEAERKIREEAERKAREEAELQARLEAEKKAKEQAELLARLEVERKAKEEADRIAREKARVKMQVLVESSEKRNRLGDCIPDLKLAPSELIQQYRQLLSSSDDYDNRKKEYEYNGETWIFEARRTLVLFFHECQIQVYKMV